MRKKIIALMLISGCIFAAPKKAAQKQGAKTGGDLPEVIQRTPSEQKILQTYFQKRIEIFRNMKGKKAYAIFQNMDSSIIAFGNATRVADVKRTGDELKLKFSGLTGVPYEKLDEYYVIQAVMNVFGTK